MRDAPRGTTPPAAPETSLEPPPEPAPETPGPGLDPGRPGQPLSGTRSPGERARAGTPSAPRPDGDAAPTGRPDPAPLLTGTRSPGERVRQEGGPAERPADDPHDATRYLADRAGHAEIAAEIERILPRWELVATYRLRNLARRHQLSANEFLVIAELLFRSNGLSGAQVADLVGLGSGGVTGILARLEERDLVERVSDPVDRRQLLAIPTPEAREVLWDDLVGTDVRGLLQGMDARDVRTVSLFVGRATDQGFRRAQAAHDRRTRR